MERLNIAIHSDYIRNGPLIQSMWAKYPGLAKKLARKISANHSQQKE
jgi:hypothetical protein